MSSDTAQLQDLRLVVFRLGPLEVGVPIERVSEIVRTPRMTRMPRVPHYVIGLMNQRGRVFPVVDLRKRLSLPAGAPDPKNRVIVVETAGDPLGLTVDEVLQVFRAPEGSLGAAPSLAESAARDYLRGVVSDGERMILMLDLEKIFRLEIEAEA